MEFIGGYLGTANTTSPNISMSCLPLGIIIGWRWEILMWWPGVGIGLHLKKKAVLRILALYLPHGVYYLLVLKPPRVDGGVHFGCDPLTRLGLLLPVWLVSHVHILRVVHVGLVELLILIKSARRTLVIVIKLLGLLLASIISRLFWIYLLIRLQLYLIMCILNRLPHCSQVTLQFIFITE